MLRTKTSEERILDGEAKFKVCDTCAAFGPQIDHGQEVECEDDGACRKNPPTIVTVDESGGFCVIFPPVNREDWCLGWVERKEETGW